MIISYDVETDIFFCVAKVKEHHYAYILPFVVVFVWRYACMHVCACALSHMMLKLTFFCVLQNLNNTILCTFCLLLLSVCGYACTHVRVRACVWTSLPACVHMSVSVYHSIGLYLFFNPSLQCFSGAHHPVDSSELAFMTAADFAVRQGKLLDILVGAHPVKL